MSVTDNNTETFSILFNTDNAFICGKSESMKTVAKQELAQLDSKDRTVYITDPYLFVSHSETTYEMDLLEIEYTVYQSK